MKRLRSRLPLGSAAIAMAAAVELGMIAVHAALNPQPLPEDPLEAWRVASENQGAVEWPAVLSVLWAIGGVAVLRRPGRFTYLVVAALGIFTIGTALTPPHWLTAIAPLDVVLVVTGMAAVGLAVAGFIPSAPLPESLPGWPEHHGGI